MTETFCTEFTKNFDDGDNDWYYLKALGQLEVSAHHDIANVNIRIEQDDTYRVCGKLWVQSLELAPAVSSPKYPYKIFTRAMQPKFTIATQTIPHNDAASNTPTGDDTILDIPEDSGVVTRVTTSTDGKYLAALTVHSSYFTVHVWSEQDIKLEDRLIDKQLDVSKFGRVSERVGWKVSDSINLEDAHSINLENADSTNHKDANSINLELAISDSGEYIVVTEAPKIGDWQEGSGVPSSKIGACIFRNPLDNVNVDDSQAFDQVGSSLVRLKAIPNKLKEAVGYATFVSAWSSEDKNTPTKFVFCDGLHLDVYNIRDGCLDCSHTISLASKISPLLRTTACELMMASITTDMFIWVEDNGRHCSTWSLNNGTAIGRFEASGPRYGNRANGPMMKVAHNQNTIAVVGVDNSVTTVDASSGITLSRRVFKAGLIEHIAFPSVQSDFLVLFMRGEEETKHTVVLVDSLRLDVRMQAPYVPPLFSSSVFGLIVSGLSKGFGAVIQPDGCLIHFYPIKEPVDSIRERATVPGKAPDTCPYELKFTIPDSPEGPDEATLSRTAFSKKTFDERDMENVLNYHRYYDSCMVHDIPNSQSETRFQIAAVFSKRVVPVRIPHIPMNPSDYRHTTEHCIKSVWLLALIYTIVTSGYQDLAPRSEGRSYEYHASAIMEFVNMHINHSISSPDKSKNFSILTHLLSNECPKGFGAKFITNLLQYDKCNWIPRADAKLHPIEMAIDHRNTEAVEALIDYCIRKASSSHSTYMTPVEKSFTQLSGVYSKLLKDIFRKVSFLPALRDDLCKSDVNICTIEWEVVKKKVWSLFPNTEAPDLDSYDNPILTFQLQEDSKHSWRSQRISKFPEIKPLDIIQGRYDYQLYIFPFPTLISLGKTSQFHTISGKNYFESPAMMAVLRYKWWKYGRWYWMVRYTILLLFYAMFMAITFTEIGSSSGSKEPQQLPAVFRDISWKKLVIADISIGCLLFIFEVAQLLYDGPIRYFGTLFNYIDIFAIISCIACLGETARKQWAVSNVDDILQQFTFTPYAIVAMYLHLAGRYDSVESDFESGPAQFLMLMIIFYVLGFILMLTVLIAQVSAAFSDACKEGERAWRMQLSVTLAEAEMLINHFTWVRKYIPILKRKKSQPQPNMIYYMAPGQVAAEYKASFRKE
ncbi:hypothetical protein BGW41_005303 [Actinomortierella wolfii]|nr:hypothetical protein BGW41_005303 [Actinomortierella wolfii]